jgi:phage tail sheath protein FI
VGTASTVFDVLNDSTPTLSVAEAKTSRDLLGDNSYAVMDSGWKYMYDGRNDVARWIPMCSDSAGIVSRTSNNQGAWFSPAGLNRGVLNSVIKLSLNPTSSERDDLYASQINPITTFPGEGAVLFGDRTLQTRPSPFDRIHVRRLMNVLEKQIATAAKLQLFEFNDNFTQRSFVSLVEPFLRGVQARSGLDSFRIVCDDTNNSQTVIDDGRFVADIFIKPLNAINVVQLNFTAQRNSASFSENIASNRVSSTEYSGF